MGHIGHFSGDLCVQCMQSTKPTKEFTEKRKDGKLMGSTILDSAGSSLDPVGSPRPAAGCPSDIIAEFIKTKM